MPELLWVKDVVRSSHLDLLIEHTELARPDGLRAPSQVESRIHPPDSELRVDEHGHRDLEANTETVKVAST